MQLLEIQKQGPQHEATAREMGWCAMGQPQQSTDVLCDSTGTRDTQVTSRILTVPEAVVESSRSRSRNYCILGNSCFWGGVGTEGDDMERERMNRRDNT